MKKENCQHTRIKHLKNQCLISMLMMATVERYNRIQRLKHRLPCNTGRRRMLIHIWAQDEQGLVGKDNTLHGDCRRWKFFKEVTMGQMSLWDVKRSKGWSRCFRTSNYSLTRSERLWSTRCWSRYWYWYDYQIPNTRIFMCVVVRSHRLLRPCGALCAHDPSYIWRGCIFLPISVGDFIR